SLQRVASAQRPEILLAARVSPTGKFSNLSVTACPVMQGQVQQLIEQSLSRKPSAEARRASASRYTLDDLD
ncbi:hypothetical protein, partial [Burkholderia gladioli]|uniref:hypothetical protein n=1 Tax=Burkholderia gladioli TaxID=28095 RepID=UPI001ABB17BF